MGGGPESGRPVGRDDRKGREIPGCEGPRQTPGEGRPDVEVPASSQGEGDAEEGGRSATAREVPGYRCGKSPTIPLATNWTPTAASTRPSTRVIAMTPTRPTTARIRWPYRKTT